MHADANCGVQGSVASVVSSDTRPTHTKCPEKEGTGVGGMDKGGHTGDKPN